MFSRLKFVELWYRLIPRIKFGEQEFLVVLAMLVGLGAGIGTVIFRVLLEFSYENFFPDQAVAGSHLPYIVPFIPAVGGLLTGILTVWLASDAKGHGVPEVMKSVAIQGGIIRFRTVVVKALASVSTICSGGSAGAEGPIVQIGSGIGSGFGQLFHLSDRKMRVLVACGAAGGIAAIFNAPLTGVMFSIEIILGDFALAAIGPVIISAVVASLTSIQFFENEPVFSVPHYTHESLWELPFYFILSVLAAGVSIAFIRMLYWSEDFWDDLKMHPLLKPALGGFLLGIVSLWFPDIRSEGYEPVSRILAGHEGILILLALLGAKLIGTCLTLGSGGSGGVFAPSLFLGAALGGATGAAVQTLFPSLSLSPGAFALVGMGTVVSATAFAPITGILLIFEITNDYNIILPLMFTCILSTIFVRRWTQQSIYTLKLSRQGIDLYQGRDRDILQNIRISEVMNPNVNSISEDTPLFRLVKLFQTTPYTHFPVVDSGGKFTGMISFKDIRPIIFEKDLGMLILAKDIETPRPVTLTRDDTLLQAMKIFGLKDITILPVIDPDDPDKLVGILTRADVMARYNRELLKRDLYTSKKTER